MKKYTLEEIKEMLSEDNFFACWTPIGKYACEHTSDYDYDLDTLDCKKAVRDAVVYGAHWIIDHLK